MIKTAVITAGGKGTRLLSITGDNIPKPMVPILGKPTLQYQIENLKRYGVVNIYVLLGHLGTDIQDYFGDGMKFGVSIQYIQEEAPLGSGGGLFHLKSLIKDDFFFLFGDLLIDVDFDRFSNYHFDHHKIITLFAHPNAHPYDSDSLVVGADGTVVKLDSKNNDRSGYWYRNLTNAGLYALSSRVFSLYSVLKKMDFEKDIVVPLIMQKEVAGYISCEYVKDIGTPDRYERSVEELKCGMVRDKNLSKPQKAIFLDRDGVINKNVGFLKDIDAFELEEDAAKAIQLINKSGYLAIVITNQPVIARGEVTFAQLDEIHNKMETLLGREGAYVDAIYFCPHHPDRGFPNEVRELKIDCACRKPKPGMIFKAKEDFNIDLNQSYLIGDTYRDIKTAENAGVKSILLEGGSANKMQEKYDSKVYFKCNNILQAVESILK